MSKRARRRVTGAWLNELWGVGAEHALYIHDGHWYHPLKRFPGALFDRYGYILFQSEEAFRGCSHLTIHPGGDVSIPRPGISAIPGYVRVGSSSRPATAEANESSTRMLFEEGRLVRVDVNRYERDERAATACAKHYGSQCFVCGFDFEEAYGPSLGACIHVHHLKPLSSIRGRYRFDPVQDLRPVCPNCHAVIHRREPPYTVSEVQRMIREAAAR